MNGMSWSFRRATMQAVDRHQRGRATAEVSPFMKSSVAAGLWRSATSTHHSAGHRTVLRSHRTQANTSRMDCRVVRCRSRVRPSRSRTDRQTRGAGRQTSGADHAYPASSEPISPNREDIP